MPAMINAEWLLDLAHLIAFSLLYLGLFLLGKWSKDLFTPYEMGAELTLRDNPAIAVSLAGYHFGLLAVFLGALDGPSTTLAADLLDVGGYSMLGLFFLNLSRYIGDSIVLRRFDCDTELSEQRNLAVGTVQGGMYLATGLIAGGSVHGTGGGVDTAVVFFLVGQCTLLVFTHIYDWLTPYDIHEELRQHNLAVGIALAGALIALGIIVGHGVSDDFVSWTHNLQEMLWSTVSAFVFLPLARWIMDRLVIPAADLSEEISRDRNIGAGLLEAMVSMSFALVLVQLV